MRTFTTRAVVIMACLYAIETKAGVALLKDTTKINHTIDGDATEWKADRFEMDKETQISYSVDHDANNLYVIMKVPEQKTQFKLMINGMSMYIDKKGKKKDATGIEFPVRSQQMLDENGDPKALREALAGGMTILQTFGIDGQDDKLQMANLEGGANVAYNWDAANNLYIEYLVPLSLLGGKEEVKDKSLSIGWRINAKARPSTSASSSSAAPTPVGSFTQAVSRNGTSTPTTSTSRGGRSFRNEPAPTFAASDVKERSFWTKYSITL